MRLYGVLRLIVVVLSMTALTFAQRGGHGGGGQRGGGGQHGNGSGAARGGGMRGPNQGVGFRGPNTGGSPYPIRTDIAPPTGLIPPAAAYTGISPGGLNVVGPRSRNSGIPVFASPIFYPGAYGSYGGGYGYGSSVRPYNDPNGGNADNSNMMAAQDALAEQIKQLSSELQSMKSNATAEPPPVPAAQPLSPVAPASVSPSPEPQMEQAPIQLLLHSGQQLSVKSYAVMDGVLWDFSSGRVRKVPISSVDIAASTKATEDKGGEFPQLMK